MSEPVRVVKAAETGRRRTRRRAWPASRPSRRRCCGPAGWSPRRAPSPGWHHHDSNEHQHLRRVRRDAAGVRGVRRVTSTPRPATSCTSPRTRCTGRATRPTSRPWRCWRAPGAASHGERRRAPDGDRPLADDLVAAGRAWRGRGCGRRPPAARRGRSRPSAPTRRRCWPSPRRRRVTSAHGWAAMSRRSRSSRSTPPARSMPGSRTRNSSPPIRAARPASTRRRRLEQPGHLAEHLVADRVRPGVVDPLEVVEVDQADGQPGAVGLAPRRAARRAGCRGAAGCAARSAGRGRTARGSSRCCAGPRSPRRSRSACVPGRRAPSPASPRRPGGSRGRSRTPRW